MARYTVSEARRQFFQLLDAAERGEEVVLERKGVRFRLVTDVPGHAESAPSPLVVDDPGVLSGQWTWVTDEQGQLQFQPLPAEPAEP